MRNKLRLSIVIGSIAAAIFVAAAVSAQTIGPISPWQYISGSQNIKPVASSSSVTIPSLGATGNPCVSVNASGTLLTIGCLSTTTASNLFLQIANNLSDVASSSASLNNLSLNTRFTGFATSSVASTTVRIKGVDAATNSFALSVVNNSNSPILVTRNDTRVGIGTTGPGSTLSVSGGATIGATFVGSGAPSNGLIVTGAIVMATTTNITPSGNNALVLATTTPRLSLFNRAASGREYVLRNGVSALGNFDIYDGTALAPRISIDSTGQVGIGTATSTSLLDVNGSSTVRTSFNLPGYGSTGCLQLTTNGLVATTTCAATASTINGVTGPFTFATSGPALAISNVGSAFTWSLPTSTASVTGVLSSLDWNTFNNKQNALTFPLTYAQGGTATSTTFTAGSIPFAGASSFDQDNANLFWSKTNRRLGIGTLSPQSPLHVFENTATTGSNAGLTIEQAGAGDAKLDFLLSGSQRWIVGADNSDADKFKISGSTGLGSDDKLTITQSGMVGIGTASPSNPLHVVSTTAAAETTPLLLQNASASDGTSVSQAFSANNVGTVTGKIQNTRNASGDYSLRLGTLSSLDTLSLRNGNVGINTTSPAATLDVNGSTTVRNALTLTNYGTTGCLSMSAGGLVATTTCGGSSGITALTGDVTATGPGSVAATLATVNSNIGTFGSATSIPIVTVNAKGLVTAVSSSTISGGSATTPSTTVYIASTTWTKPASFNYIKIRLVGGGGGGGGADAGSSESSGGGGGGGGGYCEKYVSAAALGATETLVVGSGGPGGASSGGDGTNGGTTSFGTWCSATGGVAGTGDDNTYAGGTGGTGSLGDLNTKGSGGGGGFIETTLFGPNQSFTGIGGSSALGGGGEAIASGQSAGGNYGGGGSGGRSTSGGPTTGGAGAIGAVIITVY